MVITTYVEFIMLFAVNSIILLSNVSKNMMFLCLWVKWGVWEGEVRQKDFFQNTPPSKLDDENVFKHPPS